jgi:hypothetical protein
VLDIEFRYNGARGSPSMSLPRRMSVPRAWGARWRREINEQSKIPSVVKSPKTGYYSTNERRTKNVFLRKNEG